MAEAVESGATILPSDKKERIMASLATPQRHLPKPSGPHPAPVAAAKMPESSAQPRDIASPATERSAPAPHDLAAARCPLIPLPVFRPDIRTQSDPSLQVPQSSAEAASPEPGDDRERRDTMPE